MRSALRGGRFVVQAAVVIGLLGGLLTRPATAQTSDAVQILSLVNVTRASVGLPPVAVDAALSGVAQTWAGAMAAAGTVMHNPSLGSLIGGWTALAENVGMGGSVDIVHQALVSSPSHYANMTDPRYTLAGAGSVTSGGQHFVVQVFMQGQGSSPPPPPSPPPPEPSEPEPAQEPVAELAPAPGPEPPARFSSARPPDPVPDPVPAPLPPSPPPAPTAPIEPSGWLALVFEQLQALDGDFG